MWIYVCSLSWVSVWTVMGCAVDKQQYSNTSKLSDKPSFVPVEIRKLANNSSQFHILYISDNKPAGLLCVQGKVKLMEDLFPPSFSPLSRALCSDVSASVKQGVGWDYRARLKKCGSPLLHFVGHPEQGASLLCTAGSSTTKWRARLYGLQIILLEMTNSF